MTHIDTSFSPAHPAKIVPVLLAGNHNLHLWPRSRIDMPLQFQRVSGGISPFESILQNLTTFPHALPPVITLPCNQLEAAQDQMALAPHIKSAIKLVEPVDRGSLASAVAASLLVAQMDRDALMMIIDTACPAFDWDALQRIAQQTASSPLARNNLVVCGSALPAQTNLSGSVNTEQLSKGERTADPNLYRVRPVGAASGARAYSAGEIVFATPRTFLKMAEKIAALNLAACSKALHIAQERNALLWPNINLWSAQTTHALMGMLVRQTDHILLRAAALHGEDRPLRNNSNQVFEQDNQNCAIFSSGHLTVVAGCADLEITATEDATLITPRGRPEAAAPVLARLREIERHELFSFPISYHTWGHDRLIDRGKGFNIHKLVVEPARPIRLHRHEHRAEHWHVLSGHGEARVGSRSFPIQAGFSVDIPTGVEHGCINTGARPLILLETRHGSILSSSDHKVLQPVGELMSA